MKTELKLTDELIMLLDGKGDSIIQEAVETSRLRLNLAKLHPELPENISCLISDIEQYARKNGQIGYRHSYIRNCKICEKTAGYAVYARSSSKHRKGDKDFHKPLTFSGYDFSVNFVIITGHITLGCCVDCLKIAKPLLLEILSSFPCEIPERFTGFPPKWKRYQGSKCRKCNWVGYENQMGKLRTLIGEGWYPGICPQCKVENSLFNTNIDKLDNFTLVENNQ